jgi:hypothetical protein
LEFNNHYKIGRQNRKRKSNRWSMSTTPIIQVDDFDQPDRISENVRRRKSWCEQPSSSLSNIREGDVKTCPTELSVSMKKFSTKSMSMKKFSTNSAPFGAASSLCDAFEGSKGRRSCSTVDQRDAFRAACQRKRRSML